MAYPSQILASILAIQLAHGMAIFPLTSHRFPITRSASKPSAPTLVSASKVDRMLPCITLSWNTAAPPDASSLWSTGAPTHVPCQNAGAPAYISLFWDTEVRKNTRSTIPPLSTIEEPHTPPTRGAASTGQCSIAKSAASHTNTANGHTYSAVTTATHTTANSCLSPTPTSKTHASTKSRLKTTLTATRTATLLSGTPCASGTLMTSSSSKTYSGPCITIQPITPTFFPITDSGITIIPITPNLSSREVEPTANSGPPFTPNDPAIKSLHEYAVTITRGTTITQTDYTYIPSSKSPPEAQTTDADTEALKGGPPTKITVMGSAAIPNSSPATSLTSSTTYTSTSKSTMISSASQPNPSPSSVGSSLRASNASHATSTSQSATASSTTRPTPSPVPATTSMSASKPTSTLSIARSIACTHWPYPYPHDCSFEPSRRTISTSKHTITGSNNPYPYPHDP